MTTLPWPDLEVPPYSHKNVVYGNWVLELRDNNHPKSYWCREVLPTTQVYTLSKWSRERDTLRIDGPKYKKVRTNWMSMTQFELESHMMHVAAAHGHVVVAGLGMGLFLYHILQNPDVTRVSLFEKEKDVVALMRHAGMCEWKGFWKVDKYVTDVLDLWRYAGFDENGQLVQPVDFLFVDIWPKIGDENTISDVDTIQHFIRAKSVGWWGQECDFIRWYQSKGIAMPPYNYDAVNMDAFYDWRREIQLPVVGGDWPEYATLCATSSAVVPFSVRPIKGEKPCT